LRNIKQLQTPRYAILLPSFCDALASQKSTSLPEGGFGANRRFHLSSFCFKHPYKPEFERWVRVLMCGGQCCPPYWVPVNSPTNPNLKTGSRADGGSSKPLPYDGVSTNIPTILIYTHPFFKVFWSAEPFFQKRFCVPSPTNPNLKHCSPYEKDRKCVPFIDIHCGCIYLHRKFDMLRKIRSFLNLFQQGIDTKGF